MRDRVLPNESIKGECTEIGAAPLEPSSIATLASGAANHSQPVRRQHSHGVATQGLLPCGINDGIDFDAYLTSENECIENAFAACLNSKGGREGTAR